MESSTSSSHSEDDAIPAQGQSKPSTTFSVSDISKDDGIPKCAKCLRRNGRKTCSQLACFKCCDDDECEGHRDRRETTKKHVAILDGTTEINRMAAEKRSLTIIPGIFREPAFHYLRETVVLWSLRDFLAVPKWRDDALRRSRKNRERMERLIGGAKKRSRGEGPKESRRKRFRRIMDKLYEESVVNTKAKEE